MNGTLTHKHWIQLMNKKDRCPNCGCTETVTNNFSHDQGFLEETWTECKKCKRLKHHWSYGCLFVDNWKDATKTPLNYRIKDTIKRIFTRRTKKTKTDDDLPF